MIEEILLVVYGPYTNFDHLNSWSIKHIQKAVQFEFIETVTIPDVRLNFTVPSRKRKNGELTLTPFKGGIIYGAMVKTDREGYEVIRAKIEQHGKYTEQEIIVIRANGVQLRAKAYVSSDISQKTFIEPNADYLAICEQGYSNLDLPKKQLTDAVMNQKPDTVNSIFVYGTLMRGQRNFSRINNKDLRVCLSGNVRGQLSSNGLFPALTLTGDTSVHGDFLQTRMDPKVIDRVLTATDELEGFLDFGASDNFYTRTLAWVDIGAPGLRPAWCYVQETSFDKVLQSGNWRMHREEYHEFQTSLITKYAEKHAHFWERISYRHYAKNLRMAGKGQVSLTLDSLINLINDEELYERDLAMAANFWTIF